MSLTVYVETSVISLLAARPSRDIIVAGHQRSTEDWWSKRQEYELCISQEVLDEIRRGDPEAAARRLELIAGIPMLEMREAVIELAAQLVRSTAIPAKARIDAAHVAVATVHRVPFVATWNLKHIADPFARRRIEAVRRAAGYEPPVLCTPEELMGEFSP